MTTLHSLHNAPVAMVGRLPVAASDAFPPTTDVVFFGIIYGDIGVGSLIVCGGNGSGSADVADI